jgi:hypothetical protein
VTSPAAGPVRVAPDEFRQLRCQVHGPPVFILGRARLKADRASVQVYLHLLEGEHLALAPPAEHVLDADGHLEIPREVPLHAPELAAVKECLAGVRLLQSADHRNAEELPGLMGEPEHPAQQGELAVDAGVRGILFLTLGNVPSDI